MLRQQPYGGAWRALKAALGLMIAVASLTFAGAASAAVIVAAPDNNTGSDNLTAAISQANTNSSTSNTIVLEPGTYQPKTEPITITKNLTIVGDHSLQQTDPNAGHGAITLQGSLAQNTDNNLFVIPNGINVTMEGWECDSCGASGFAGFAVSGHLTWWGMETIGDEGQEAMDVTATGVANLNESSFEDDLTTNMLMAPNSTVTLNNVSMDQGTNYGITIQGTPYTLNMNNTLMAYQSNAECQGGTVTNGGPGSLDDDGTCGVQYSDDTNVDSYYPINPGPNGGANYTSPPPAGNPDTTDRGVNCPVTDERFFVNPVAGSTRQCDIGAITNSATQETSAPSCKVTSTNETTTPATQQVSLADPLSGIGPQPGPATDNPSNTTATAYPPPAAVPVPGYAVDNLQINNGTVGFTSPTAPSTNPLVLTASKTTPGEVTQWSFTGLNWAGIAKNCY